MVNSPDVNYAFISYLIELMIVRYHYSVCLKAGGGVKNVCLVGSLHVGFADLSVFL